MEDAVKNLCTINTAISGNILHMAAKRKDIKVVTHEGDMTGITYGSLDLNHIRRMAASALNERGNPPYNPNEYLKPDAWKIYHEPV